jgi:peptide subunit release factor 1 (eRF1)
LLLQQLQQRAQARRDFMLTEIHVTLMAALHGDQLIVEAIRSSWLGSKAAPGQRSQRRFSRSGLGRWELARVQ